MTSCFVNFDVNFVVQISTCLAKDPSRRPSPTQILANPWFTDALGNKKTKSTTNTTDVLPNDVVVIA